MQLLRMAVLAAVLALGPAAGLAHEEKAGPNGGPVQDAGKFHVELVMKADELRAFVTADKDVKVDTKGAEAVATVLAGKEKATVKLAPAGGNALAGPGRFDPAVGVKVVLSLSMPGEAPVQARFSIAAKPGGK